MSTLKVDAIGKFDTTANAITFDSNNNASFTGSVNATNPMMNRNLLINGGMNIWQRSTSESVTTTGYYTVDRFEWSRNGSAVYTMSRSTDIPSAQGFGYSLKLDNTTALASPSAANYVMFMQKIEGQNLQHLLKGTSSAKKVTLSFWVKSNKTGTYIARLSDVDNSRHTSKSYTIDSSNTWEKKTITYDGDTTGALDNDNNGSLELQFWLSAGTDYTSGTLATSWESSTSANIAVGQVNLSDSTSNEWYVTGVQLEVGSQATNFEFEPYEKVLYKCQRYYDQNTGQLWGAIAGTATALQFGSARYTREMRASPTVVLYGSGTANRVRRGSNGTTVDVSSGATIGRNAKGIDFITKTSAFNAGSWYQAGYTANAEL